MDKAELDVQELNSYVLNCIVKKPSETAEMVAYQRQKSRQHFLLLIRNISSTSDGQATVITEDKSYKKFIVLIEPHDGPFSGGSFKFLFHLPCKYPTAAPDVKCLSKIFHPNIDVDGEICISIIDDWCPEENDLLDCVQGLLYLLYNPNFDDPLNPNFAPGDYVMEDFCDYVHNLNLNT